MHLKHTKDKFLWYFNKWMGFLPLDVNFILDLCLDIEFWFL